MTKEVLKLALEALTYIYTETTADEDELIDKAIAAIKEALAKEKALQDLHDENERLGLYKDAYAEQEPVAIHQCQPLYTHPVKDLEDIDINITWNENSMRDFGKDELNFARAILRKAQEK